ncbi:hypothetical protein R5R35_008517 [Gryllus longicercus]|uniref:Fe2OG dioxygenase domain-containing protein n=1 Tax=Gryllus longicercus TaxID=2509291 RepID=A0AAN9VLB0_9ORTH
MDTLLSRAEIPIIDLAHMGTAEAPVRSGVRRVAAQLHSSLAGKGLALLVNHGIPEERLRAVYRALDKFCELPPARRAAYLRQADAGDNHGYVPPGCERFSGGEVREVRHAFNVARLDRGLPDAEVPGFSDVAAALADDFRRLAALLLRALATGLGLQGDYFLRSHARMMQSGNATCMRTLYYPPLGAEPTAGLTRCGEHADYGTFTLLAQDCEGGLEVQLPNRRWGRVGHLPGAILVNAGELLETWTGGNYAALRHRVVVPEQEGARCRGRHSVAFFVHPDDDTPVAPLALTPAEAEAQTQASGVATPPGRGLARLMSAPAGKPSPKHSPIYTAYQHLQMRLRETYAS